MALAPSLWRGAAGDRDVERAAALAGGDDVAADSARLGVEHGAGAACGVLDLRAAGRRADLFVGGEQRDDGEGEAAGGLDRPQREDVGDEPGLHVADAGAEGHVAIARIAARRDRAFLEHGVAVAHHQRIAVRLLPRHFGAQHVAETLLREAFDGDAVRRKHLDDRVCDVVSAGLVEAVGVDVDEAMKQRLHLVVARRQPGDDVGGDVVHLLRSLRMRWPSSPRS
jgi:hypothetical protein